MAEQGEQERLRAYLKAQGAKLSVEQIRERIQEAAEDFLAAVGEVSEAVARTSPAPGEWSLAEIVDHVVTAQEHIRSVITGMVAGRPPSAPMDIGARSGLAALPWSDLVERLRRSQTALSELLAAHRQEPHVDLRVPEGYFGELNWKEYALVLRLHYKDHASQARRTVEAVTKTTG